MEFEFMAYLRTKREMNLNICWSRKILGINGTSGCIATNNFQRVKVCILEKYQK